MKRKAFYRIIFERFWKSRLNRVGFVFVMAMLVLLVAAPLIANNKPYYYVHAGRLTFPILKDVFPFSTFVDYPELRDVNFRELSKDPGERLWLPPIPYSPSEYDLDQILMPPSAAHWMGTDDQGRDVAARMVYGAQVSLLVGVVAVVISLCVGIVIGALAGYFGGRTDLVLSRLIEVVMCFPTFLLILTILAVLEEPKIIYIMFVIGLTGWTGIARLVRGEFLKLRDQDFVTSTRALGLSTWRIIFRHILPNALSPVMVSATFGVASAILVESSLSFLGFGVQPPTPSWGQILSLSREFMDIAWWLMVFPGFAIFFTITAFNLVGEGLRDAVDPRTLETKT